MNTTINIKVETAAKIKPFAEKLGKTTSAMANLMLEKAVEQIDEKGFDYLLNRKK